jgi:hypothetical protein
MISRQLTGTELDRVSGGSNWELSALRGGAEMNMIEMQSLLSKRGTTLQLTVGIINSLQAGIKAAANNIR